MFLKPKLRCFPCLGLDSLASYMNKPWGLDPINPFSCDYERTPRITYMNIQNRRSELNKRYPFPRILCPVLGSKLFLCFTKNLLPMWLIIFQTSAQAILGKVPGGLPVNLFRFSSSCETPTGQAPSQRPLPFARELMICTLREINLLCSNTYPGTIPWHFPRGSHTPSS